MEWLERRPVQRLLRDKLWRTAVRALSVTSLLAAVCLLGEARAEPVDPSLPSTVVVGVPNTPAPLDRLDRGRRSLANVAFPEQLVETQRKTVGALVHAPIIHADRSISLALMSPELLRLDPAGEELARVHLGSAAAVRPPVLLPNGSLAVLTGAPSVVFVSAAGKVTATITLPRASFTIQSGAMGFVEGIASIVPSEDGAVVVAANRALLEIDASARVRAKVTLPERLASEVLPHPDGWLVVGESGAVYSVKPPQEPKKLGSLSGIFPGTATLLDARTLVAQAPPNRILALDLKSGTSVTRIGDSIFSMFDAIPAYDAGGNTWVTTVEGFLVGYDASGAEIARTAADRSTVAPGLVSFAPGRQPLSPPTARTAPIVDKDGRVAFARPSGRFGVRGAKGTTSTTDRACNTPIAIVPQADQQLLLACRDGTLIFYGETPKNPAAEGAGKEK